MTTLDLDPHAPDSPDRTRALAAAAADAVRALNHATIRGRGGLTYPADAHGLLSTLGHIAASLPQLCTQVGTWLADQQAAGHLREHPGGRYRGHSQRAVTAAESALAEAGHAAARLASLLGEAQSAISAVEYAGPDDDDAEGTECGECGLPADECGCGGQRAY